MLAEIGREGGWVGGKEVDGLKRVLYNFCTVGE